MSLGPPIRKTPPKAAPQWKQVEGAAKGIEVGPDGRWRNNAPTPADQHPWFPYFPHAPKKAAP